MADSAQDRITLARIAAIVRRRTASGALSDESRSEAVAELVSLAGNRPDLLAEAAGLALGLAAGGNSIVPHQYELQAELCLLAGADTSLIDQWRPIGFGRALGSGRRPSI